MILMSMQSLSANFGGVICQNLNAVISSVCMNNGFDDSLHKILRINKEKIILLLTEKGSLSYTNLLDSRRVNNGR